MKQFVGCYFFLCSGNRSRKRFISISPVHYWLEELRILFMSWYVVHYNHSKAKIGGNLLTYHRYIFPYVDVDVTLSIDSILYILNTFHHSVLQSSAPPIELSFHINFDHFSY
ncbi:hypothetical protein KIN20_035531 [Parelaphostrongylus tenuis]|uniref:Uncharacterized protein n=1 Tax=Parelaphostrongylus tenuis TaxID=148309 RepID=A0AAD5RBN2_PARTN|nr:hypothetical protein KIN20_035531 [Parelaphostrongylus tenuis]